MTKKTQTIAIAGAILVVLIGLSFAASRPHTTDQAPAATTTAAEAPAAAAAPTSAAAQATPAATTTPAPAAAPAGPVPGVEPLTKKGEYEAECLVPGTGTLIGHVAVKSNQKADKIKSVDVMNMNTKKVTSVDVTTARCTFVPVK